MPVKKRSETLLKIIFYKEISQKLLAKQYVQNAHPNELCLQHEDNIQRRAKRQKYRNRVDDS